MPIFEGMPQQPNKIKADFELRESLPKTGKPMLVVETRSKKTSDIPGVAALDQNQKINWDNLIFVRTTDVMPKVEAQTLVVQTPYSGTKNKSIEEVDPRTTTHWTINHHVRATAGGWRREDSEELPYIIIAPAKGLVDLNGLPKNFADVDSFWDKNLILPEGTTIICQPDKEFLMPAGLKNKIHLIFREKELTAETDVADVLSKLDYTAIKGGQKYSRTDGVAELFNAFAEKNNLESGSHQMDETNRFENTYSKLDNPELMIDAIKQFISPRYESANPQIRELIDRKLKSIAQSDINSFKKSAQKYRLSETEAEDIFHQAKALLEEKI